MPVPHSVCRSCTPPNDFSWFPLPWHGYAEQALEEMPMPSTAHSGVVAALLAQQHEPGTVIRIARTAAGWSQAELGRRCGYSASQVSRWETGRVPLRDVTLLRTLAGVLGLPPEVFGLLADDTTGAPHRSIRPASHKVIRAPIPRYEEDDPVRRRSFLVGAGLAGTPRSWSSSATALAGEVDPAALLARQLGDVLLGADTVAGPVAVSALREAFTAARRDFSACRYMPLAGRLPALIAAAEATATHHPDPAAHQVLAESYNLATRTLIKLEASGLEWLCADRALHAARAAEDPLTLVESQRLVASVARRAGHHDHAQTLTLAAAHHLDLSGARPAPEHLAMYGMLHCSAGYAAARAGDRDRANELLTDAQATAARLAHDRGRQQELTANIVSHRVSAAYVLGDAGTALAHAHSLPLAAIPTTERRARLLVDVAMSYAQWDKPDRAYRTLLAAERAAPGEVHTRNAVRRLVTDLMTAHRQATMPGLPALAARVHANI
ncbi:MAG: helix-turn-helix domain-containing protein [Pseudonocardiaceae bacterium]